MDNASRPRAEHVFVNLRVTRCADDQQFDAEIGGEPDDVAHRMSGHNMRMDLHLALFGHRASALQDAMKAARGRSGLLTNLFDEFRHVVDLFHRHRVKFGIVLLGDRDRQSQRAKRVLRPVVGVQDFAEHRAPPALFG